MSADAFDIVIAGGGPAGLAVALQLARAGGVSVAVIQPKGRRVRFGETLPPGCRPLFAQLGILQAFTSGPHARCEGTMAAWGSADVHYTDYLLHPERHGWRIDRSAFEEMLAREALQRGTTIIETAVRAVSSAADGWIVTTEDGDIRARIVVDATGRQAVVGRMLGARKLVDDHLVGIAGVFETSAPVERDYPLIEAREDGWLYSSMLAGEDRLAVVAMTDSDLAHTLRLHDEEPWRQWIASAPHTSRRIDGARCVEGPITASACSQRLDPIAGEAWLALGDAASAFDPLSSLGITKALREGIRTASAIQGHLAGDRQAFDTYAQEIAAEYDAYLATRTRYYAMESRWGELAFWKRRGDVAS